MTHRNVHTWTSKYTREAGLLMRAMEICHAGSVAACAKQAILRGGVQLRTVQLRTRKPRLHGNARLLALAFGLLCALAITSGGAEAETSAEYLQEAQAYLEKGEPPAAVIQLKNALLQDPENMQARLLLGETYLMLGQLASAAKELERARDLGAAPQDVLVPLGRVYLLQGKHRQVLDEITVPEGAPAPLEAEILVLHGEAELALGELGLAEARFTQAGALDPDNTRALLGLARIGVAEKDYAGAGEHVAHALALEPENADAWLVKGELARLQGDLEAARRAFGRAVELDPTNFLARLGKATVHLGLGEYDAAAEDIQVLAKRAPNNPMVNYQRAVLAYRQSDLAGAEEALRAVQRVTPGHLPSALLLGVTSYAQGNYEQAEVNLVRYVAAVPQNGMARKLLAATYLKLGESEAAIATLDVGLAQAEEDPQWLALLGSAYVQAGESDRAIEWLEKAVSASPDLAVLRNRLAIVQLQQGETEQAVTELETAVDLGQDLIQSDVLLVLAHARNQDLEQARKIAQGLVERQPDLPLSHNLLGAVYADMGDVAQARQQFQQALELAPNYTSAEMNLARLDLQAGELDQAEGRLRAILDHDPRHLGAMMALAQLEQKRGRRDEALAWLIRAWEKNPGALQPGLELATYYGARGEHLKVVEIARELESAHPDNPQVLQTLGTARLAMGEHARAIDTLRKAAELQSQSPKAYWLLANAQTENKDYEGAIASLNRALELKSDYLPAQVGLVLLKQRTNHPQDALGVARQIQQQHPEAPQGYVLEGDIQMAEKAYAKAAESYAAGFNRQKTAELAVKLFQARRRAGEVKSAREPLEQWLSEHPNDVRVHQMLAQASLEAGESAAAVEHYQAVVNTQPENVVALNNLALLLHEQDDPKALEYAEQAYDLAPDNPDITDTLGWLLLKYGDPGRGLVLTQEAAMKAPHQPSIRYHMAVALSKNGRKTEARKEIQRLLRDNRDFPEIDEARALLAQLQQYQE